MLEVGGQLGRYRIDRTLGAGGMGEVYEAYDTLLRRSVALKVVRKRSSASDEQATARLLREARSAAALRHPNAVAVFDLGEQDGTSYIAMELVSGKTLRTFVGNPSIAIAQRVRWLLDIGRALEAAHAQGIIHRDVKPDNVMVGNDGIVKVLDFGIAKRADDTPIAPPGEGEGPASFKTKEGFVVGTPRYMAPEQIAGAPLDARTDQFAWGVVAYELLSGKHPHATIGATARWEKPIPKLSNVPEAISKIVMRAIEKEPAHRWPAIADLVRELEIHGGVTRALAIGAEEMTTAESRQAASTEILDESGVTHTEAPPTQLDESQVRTVAVPSVIAARVCDPRRPPWRRATLPIVAPVLLFAGYIVFSIALSKNANVMFVIGQVIFRIGWGALFLAPLFALARKPRDASISLGPTAIAIRGARGMSQRISGASIVGVASAVLPSGRVSVVISPKRVVSQPITIEVATEDEAHALLGALGATRAHLGTLSWPVKNGALDVIAFGAAIAWRIVIAVGYLVPTLGTITIPLALLSGLATMALAFAPRPGPHVELTPDQLRIYGAKGDSAIALTDVARAEATTSGITVHLRAGAPVAIDVALPFLFAKKGLTPDERAHVAAQISAAAARASAAYA